MRAVALEASPTFRGSDVARILGLAGAERGLPQRIRVDHGTEFTSKALDHWAYWNRVELDFIRPGKPTDNPFIEAFNATLRRECLSQHWFLDLDDAQTTLDRWKEDYNNHRPHSSLRTSRPPTSGPAAISSQTGTGSKNCAPSGPKSGGGPGADQVP